MQPRKMSEQELLKDIGPINMKLNVIKERVAKIDPNIVIKIDGKSQNLKSILDDLFPVNKNIDGTNLIEYWNTDKLANWEKTLDQLALAILADGTLPPDVFDALDIITSHTDTLRHQVMLLCSNYYNTQEEPGTKKRRATLLFNMPPAKIARLGFENELENTAKSIQDGEPALDAINHFLSTEENRNKVLGIGSFKSGKRTLFKRRIYKKSIENMARAIIEEDRNLFIKVNTNELFNVSLTELAKPENRAASPTRTAYADRYNNLSAQVATDILTFRGNETGSPYKDPAQIAFAIDYWINVAYLLSFNTSLPDLNGGYAVYSGLTSGSIIHLFNELKENGMISKATLTKFKELEELYKPDKNFKNLRKRSTEHANAILPIGILQKDLEKTIRNPKTIAIAQREIDIFGMHQGRAANTQLEGGAHASNIGEARPDNELSSIFKLISTVQDGKRKFTAKYKPKDIQDHLNKVKIKKPSAIKVMHVDNAAAESITAKEYHLKIDTADKQQTQIYQALQEIGVAVATEASAEEKTLDIYTAAKDFCEHKSRNENFNKFMEASPLIKALAIAHYIIKTEKPHETAMPWFNIFVQHLSPNEKKNFYSFIQKFENYKSKFELPELDINDFVIVKDKETTGAFSKLGYTKKYDKTGGANPAGPYGGVYVDRSGKKALFKSEPDKEKVVGEYYAGELTYKTLNRLHQSDDDHYSEKYVGKVSLEIAENVGGLPIKNPDELVYLKSEFIPNIGDFWTVAYALNKKKLGDYKDPTPQEIISAIEADAIAFKQGRGNKRPPAIIEATFGLYDKAAIKILSDFILTNDLLNQFCEMVAVRLLFGDFGVHNGNFVVFANVTEDGKIQFKFGAIDFGAGFDGFKPTISPFKFKASIFTFENLNFHYYKNHLLEYVPDIMKGRAMAEAFIKAGEIKEGDLRSDIESIITEEKSKVSIQTLKNFCARIKMPFADYQDINDKSALLNVVRNFIFTNSVERKNDLANIGYGLLIENCFVDKNGCFYAAAPLNTELLTHYLKLHPALIQFIDLSLNEYSQNRGVSKDRLMEAKTFCDKNRSLVMDSNQVLAQFTRLSKAIDDETEKLRKINDNIDPTDEFEEDVCRKKLFEFSSLFASLMERHAAVTSSGNDLVKKCHESVKESLTKFNLMIESLKDKTKDAPKKSRLRYKAPEPKAESANAFVLTIAMLGTQEHREQGSTLLTQFCKAIDSGKNQSVHLIDGPAGIPASEDSKHPMLGTYDITKCVRNPENGVIELTKEPKISGACSPAAGLISGAGTNDAIAEALLVIETMLKDKKDVNVPLTINLAGFSRGADNTIRLANAIAEKYTRDEVVVNIFALDPVPGPMRKEATKARLIPDIVQNYEAVLMRNEPRSLFKARDKRNITVQDPSATNVKYHLYRGVHSQGNYFYADPTAVRGKAFDEELKNEIRQSEAARLAANDLYEFAEKHGAKLKDRSLHHVQYAESANRKTVQAARLTDQEKLAVYIRMMQTDFDTEQKELGKKVKDASARDFTKNLSDYFLHGTNFFIDRTHMELVFARLKDNYKHVLDHLFQNDLEYGRDFHASSKCLEELRDMQTKDPDLYYCLKDFPNAPEFDPKWKDKNTRNHQSPYGIPVRVSTFYQSGNPLNKQWELLVAALSPAFIGQDHALSSENAEQYYKRAYAILCDKKGANNLDEREANQAAAIKNIVTEINDKKIQHALRKSKSADEHKNMINAVYAKLERALGKKKSYPSIYKDILQALRDAAKEIAAKNLAHDPQLVNQLLNEALHAINQTESEYKGGSNDFKKAIRKCIIMASTTNAPELTADQAANAAKIISTFASSLKMNIDNDGMIENPTFKSTEIPAAPREGKDKAEFGAGAAPPASDNTIDPAITNLRACTTQIIQMLREASEKMNSEARLPDGYKPALAPKKVEHPIIIADSPVHRFFYRNPHDKTTPVINPFVPPSFDFR